MNRPDRDTLYRLFEECLHAPYRQVENGGSYAIKRRNSHVTVFFEDSDGALDWRNNFRFWVAQIRRRGCCFFSFFVVKCRKYEFFLVQGVIP